MSYRSNRNALKHGVFAGAMDLTDEEQEEFKKIHQSLIQRRNPQGPDEEDKILNVATNIARKRCYRLYWQRQIEECKILEVARDRFDVRLKEKANRFIADLRAGKFETLTEKDLKPNVGSYWTYKVKKFVPRSAFQSDAEWRDAVKEFLIESEVNENVRMGMAATFEDHFYAGEILEKILAFEERIDGKIAKDLKELGQIKTMQALGLGKRNITVEHEPLTIAQSPPVQAVDGEK